MDIEQIRKFVAEGQINKTYIITAYQPDLNHFEADFKTRRQQ